MVNKSTLRRYYRYQRYGHRNLSALICQAVLCWLEANASTWDDAIIGLYWPLAGEVDLQPLRDYLSNPVALPITDGYGSIRYRIWDDQPLVKDGCGIPAPSAGLDLNPRQIGLLLVPALAVDFSGIRLGYGGGYYDRLRSDPLWAVIPAWVILPSACICSNPLPRDSWDIPFNGWISEQGPSLALASSLS
ncbi:5-formyltetrahydrofolate cyclo-ligase [Synechococcus sp. M16CYN]|uniref:5-formyltetrahydrofolate cyclo-ligase n=1 Tax=Synechococcus sp. M16CYN TaxID=3103139 RepID=UPI003252C088